MVRTPKYRLHKASGKAIVTLAGKDIYLGEHGSPESKKLYKRLLSEYLANDGKASPNDPASISVSELLASFLRHAKKHYGTKTRSEYEHYARIVPKIRDLYGPTLASEFGPVQFKTIRQSFIKNGNARKYVNAVMARVLRIFRWASGEGLINPMIGHALRDIEPLRKGRSEAKETEPILPVEDDVVDKTIPHLPPVVRDMVKFQRLVGCRPGEICSITPGMVNRSTDVWEIHLDQHKTSWRGKKRVIYVGPKGQAILAPYLLRDADSPCFAPKESERKRREKAHAERVTPLSCGNVPGSKKKQRRAGLLPPKVGAPPPGKRYTTGTYGRAIQRACDKAFPPPEGLSEKEIKEWTTKHRWAPNQLRHSFGTMVRREFGLEESQILLGHASADVTQIYAERDSEKARSAARRIG